MFASQYAAYDLLSPAMQKMLGGLRAVHRDYSIGAGLAVGQYERLTDDPYDSEFVHPVVRTHPETGRKALFLNAKNVQRFEDMTEEESRPMLDYLFAHCSRAEICWRHHWQAGDVLIWDNACVQHAVVGDVPKGMDRTMHRITICGEAVL